MAELGERDGLHEPLGLAPSARVARPSGRRLAFASCALLLGALGAYVVATDNHLGGEPFAVASIERRPAEPLLPTAPAAAVASAPPVAGPTTSTGAQIEA